MDHNRKYSKQQRSRKRLLLSASLISVGLFVLLVLPIFFNQSVVQSVTRIAKTLVFSEERMWQVASDKTWTDQADQTEWIHYKWEKSGETLYDPVTGKYKYTAYSHQTNVDIGGGNYAPYAWDPLTKTAKFADCEIRFFDNYFEFWQNGEKLTESKIRLHKNDNADWKEIPLFFDDLMVDGDDKYATATLGLKDGDGNEVITNIRFGMFHHVDLGFEINVSTPDDYRLEIENAGLSGEINDIHSTDGLLRTNNEKEDRIVGMHSDKMFFRWTYEEAKDRIYSIESKQNGKVARKIIELGALSPDKPKLIFPDTWGPTAIAQNSDDGTERMSDSTWHNSYSHGNSCFICGYYNTWTTQLNVGLRWDNITASGNATSGCQIQIYYNNTLGAGATADLYGVNENDPATWSSTRRPSTVTHSTSTVTWNPPGTTAQYYSSPELKDIIQQLFDNNHNSGEAMAFAWISDTPTGANRAYDYYDFAQSESNKYAKLTIVYTPNTPVTDQNHYRWRNDSTALNTTGGWLASEDTAATTTIVGTTTRLRVEIANTGATTTANYQYRLEYAEKIGSTCGDNESFAAVPTTTTSAPFEIAASSKYSNNASTTVGFLTGVGTRTNGYGIEDPENKTPQYPLTNAYYTEFEYALKSTANATSGPYCFRLTNNGSTTNFTYTKYPELEVRFDLTLTSGDISFSNNNPSSGEDITISAVLHNDGVDYTKVTGGNTCGSGESNIGNKPANYTMVEKNSASKIQSDGIITKWKVYFGTAVTTVAKLKIFRESGGQYLYIGESSQENITAGSCLTFTTNIHVREGDLVGVWFQTDDAASGAYIAYDSFTNGMVYKSGQVSSDTSTSTWTGNNAKLKLEVWGPDIDVTFFDGDPDSSGTQINGTSTITSLASGATTTATTTWTTGSSGNHDIYVVIDKGTEINETNENNNTASTSITVLDPPALEQNHYRWRDDTIGLNSSSTGSWLASEDTLATTTIDNTSRLRVGVANTGNGTSTDYQYRLEYARKVGSTCGDNETFAVVPTSNSPEPFEIVNSAKYTNYASTTSGLLSYISTTTRVNGYGVEDPSNITGGRTLNPGEYTELEYTLEANSSSNAGGDYCFRLTNNGLTNNFTYTEYPEIRIGWCQNWDYYKQVSIHNSTTTLTDFQTKIEVDTQTLVSAGKLQSQCQDMRFVGTNNKDRLSYWFESADCNATGTEFWVKVPSLPNGTTTIYMYYGNSNASSDSSGDDTFIFFDDFENGNLNKWTTVVGWTADTDQKKYGTYSAKSSNAWQSLTKEFTGMSSGIFETWVKFNSNAVHSYPLLSNEYGYWMVGKSDGHWAWLDQANGWNYYANDLTYSAGVWYFLQMKFDFNDYTASTSGTYWGWIDGSQLTTNSGLPASDYSGNTYTEMTKWRLSASDGGNYFWTDDLRIRKYASTTDPTASVGGENVCSTGITISGIAMEYDQTASTTSGTVKIAIDSTPQSATHSISNGSWSISNITATSGQVVTAWVDGAATTSRAVAVTKYDGNGDIDGMLLYKRHLSVGSDDCQTITNTDLSQYDNSVSGDADIFHDVSGTTLTVDTNSDFTDEELYIKASDTLAPGGNTNTHDIEIQGTFTASTTESHSISGSWFASSIATFTAASSTITFTATSTGETLTSAGNSFHNLIFSGANGGWSLNGSIDVGGDLNMTAGTATGTYNMTVHGGTASGNGTLTFSDGTNLINIESISAGASHTCAVSNTGNVYCWGYDLNGRLGNGAPTGEQTTPDRVLQGADTAEEDTDGTNLINIKSISAGASHTCAVSNTGNVYCWGSDGNGKLGNGATTSDQTVPDRVLEGADTASEDTNGTNLINIKSISASNYHTCAVSNSGNTYCWGNDTNGRLGNGATTSDQTVPDRVLEGDDTADEDTNNTNLINIKSVSAGSFHTCAVSNTGNTYCWGSDGFGRLGNGAPTGEQTTPDRVLQGADTADEDTNGTNLINIKNVSAGSFHTCAVSNSGNTYCWGNDLNGRLGNGATTSEQTVPDRVLEGDDTADEDTNGTNLINIKNVSAGASHTCAVSNTGNVYCWGSDGNGKLGNGATTSDQTVPDRVLEGADTASEDTNGTNLINIKSVSAGSHTCAVSNSGHTYCWGEDAYGKLGNGAPTADQTTPDRVLQGADTADEDTNNTNLINIKNISAGNGHTCAVSNTGNTYCWGFDGNGQLGNGAPTADQTTPDRVLKGADTADEDTDGTNLVNIKSISAGKYHTCAVSNSGNTYCWGSDGNGKLGNGAAGNQTVPDRVLKGADTADEDTDGTNLINIKSISVGKYHTCAVSNASSTYCWGFDGNGQLGNGAPTANQTTPDRVLKGADTADEDTDGTNLVNIKSIDAGLYYTCAVSNASSTYCWGFDGNGQLGNGAPTANQTTPDRVLKGADTADEDTDGTNLVNIKSISADDGHTCAVSNSGNTYCWGSDDQGQLGNGAMGSTTVPDRVLKGSDTADEDTNGTNLINIKSISVGKNHTCAVSNASSTYCWGDDGVGKLGNGAAGNQTTPDRVLDGADTADEDTDGVNLVNIKSISAGDGHTCTVSNSGNTYCWGFDGNGKLGNGATGDTTVPDRALRGEANESTSDIAKPFFTLLGEGNFGGSSPWSFVHLVFGDAHTTATTTSQGTASTTISQSITVKQEHVLNAGIKDWILSAGGTPFTEIGTFTASSSTFRYTSASSTNLTTATYHNLELKPTSGSPFYSILTGTLTVGGTLTIGDGTHAVTTVATTSDPTVDVKDLTISSNATYESSGTSTLYVAGNYTNNGTFTANSGTTTFDGTSQQTLSGTMTGTSAFYNFKITNNSGTDPVTSPSFIFSNAAASSTNLYVTTASVKLRFHANKDYTFTNFYLDGGATNTRVQLRSSTPDTAWKLFVTGDQSVLNTDAKDSDAGGGQEIDATDSSNYNAGGNTNWDFGDDYLSFTISTEQISFGLLSSGSARFASSTAQGDSNEVVAHTLLASTTASDGYTITVRGATLTSGGLEIDAMDPVASSTNGSEQFGIRLTASGGIGQVSSPYNQATSYAYEATAASTDVVASAGEASEDTTYSIYYVSNIQTLTEAGDYTTAITYVITGNF